MVNSPLKRPYFLGGGGIGGVPLGSHDYLTRAWIPSPIFSKLSMERQNELDGKSIDIRYAFCILRRTFVR